MEKKELYLIMNNFIEVEYEVKAISTLLENLKTGCDNENQYCNHVINKYIMMIEKELSDSITELEKFILKIQ